VGEGRTDVRTGKALEPMAERGTSAKPHGIVAEIT
jgi:hypothetical protein